MEYESSLRFVGHMVYWQTSPIKLQFYAIQCYIVFIFSLNMNSASGSQGPSVSSTDNKEGNHTGKFKNPGKVLIVTNVHDQVFEDDSIRVCFCALFI